MSVFDKIYQKKYESELPYVPFSENKGREWQARLEDEQKLLDQFKKDALEECGIQDHPKAEIAFQHAWVESCNGYNLSKILYYLEIFAEVMK